MARVYKTPKKIDPQNLRTTSESNTGVSSEATWRQSGSRNKETPRTAVQGTDSTQRTMAETMELLVSLVAQEAECCERLLVLMRCQQKLLIQGNARRIEANVWEQEAALLRLRFLERRRHGVVSAFVTDSAQQFGTSDVAKVIATVFNDFGNRLSGLHTSMRSSIQRLNETKEQNRLLIERSLANIAGFLSCLDNDGAHSGGRPRP